MQKILASLILAFVMFIGAALPRFNDTPKAQGVHTLPIENRNQMIFGDGAHKNWKLAAESSPEFEK